MKRPTFAAAPLLAAALLCVPAILGLQAARAETNVYRDVLRPNGVERSQTQKFADGRACGAKPDNTFTNVATFEKCMRARGWALDHAAPDASDVGGATYDDIWGSAKGPRGDPALHADSRRCDPSGTADVESPAMKQCMLRRGWRLSFVLPDPNANAASEKAEWNPTGDHNVWTDATRRNRGDAAAAADADYCMERTGPDPVGEVTSPSLKRCMASRGWRFDHTEGQTTWIDPDSGLTCHSEGIASVCSNF